MMRSFQVTLTSNAVSYNLLTLLLATVGAVPTDGYFPNPCTVLDIVVNGAGTFTITDSLDYGITGQIGFHREAKGNRIDLSQWKVQGDTDAMTLGVSVEGT
jgi:hypothetical protein